MKEHVLTTACVSFTWAARMDSHVERQQVRVRVNNALGAGRRVSLPDGWSVALGALGKLRGAREIPPAEIPPNVTEVRCDLVGVPKPVAPAVAGLAPGACVALSHHGVRVNFVLIAHISGSAWFCSSGGRSFGETIVPETVWHNDFCFQKDLTRDAWDDACQPERRVTPRVKVDSLLSLVVEFPVEFDALVAQKAWEAEVLLAQADNRQLDVATASSMYESNPFVSVAYPKWRGEVWRSHLQVEYL